MTFKDFLSTHFVLSVSNFTELVLTLALLDLPFSEESHGLRSE